MCSCRLCTASFSVHNPWPFPALSTLWPQLTLPFPLLFPMLLPLLVRSVLELDEASHHLWSVFARPSSWTFLLFWRLSLLLLVELSLHLPVASLSQTSSCWKHAAVECQHLYNVFVCEWSSLKPVQRRLLELVVLGLCLQAESIGSVSGVDNGFTPRGALPSRIELKLLQ